MEPRDMMRSKGERAPCPAAPQPVLLASARPEVDGSPGSGGPHRRAAALPEAGSLLPVSR